MDSLLNHYESLDDLKKMDYDELRLLARDIRRFLIESVSQTGGHLASNLGVVELTLAMHYCFDSPDDKFIFDVGHQSYVHKILTGRKEQMSSIRQYGGMSGFPKRSESIHDIFNTGHSSTSISAAMGFAKKRDLMNEDYQIVSVIGDGSFTGGLAYEALNNAAALDSPFIIVLNDNQMSIAENVGGMSIYLDSIRTANIYNEVKEDVQKVLRHIPKIGDNMISTIRELKDGLKQMIIPGMFFEEMGYTYLGPIDGHNIKQLIMSFNQAKKVNKPTIIHVNTVKGKGYSHAEKYPSTFHGVPPFNKKTGKPLKAKSSNTFSNMFGNTMIEMAKDDELVVGITAAMPGGTGLCNFKNVYPDRLFDVGIAEQHAVTFSAGLSVAGLKPYVAIYSSFLQRAYDQIVHDVALQKLPVVFCIDRSGLVGEDGETHHGVFDTAYLAHIPNMTIMAPKDGEELREMLIYAKDYFDGPIAIKYPKGDCSSVGEPIDTTIELGCHEVVNKGEKVAIIAVGSMYNTTYKVYEQLKAEGFNYTLINQRFIKPYDIDGYKTLCDTHDILVVVEENSVIGGFGSEILRTVQGLDTKVVICGIEDRFITHGSRNELLDECGLSEEKLYNRIKKSTEN